MRLAAGQEYKYVNISCSESRGIVEQSMFVNRDLFVCPRYFVGILSYGGFDIWVRIKNKAVGVEESPEPASWRSLCHRGGHVQ